jgi:hypothetical protein
MRWAVLTARLLRLLPDLTQSPLKGVARLTDPLAHIPYVAQPTSVPDASADAEHGVVASVAGWIQSAKGETHAVWAVNLRPLHSAEGPHSEMGRHFT